MRSEVSVVSDSGERAADRLIVAGVLIHAARTGVPFCSRLLIEVF